MSANITGLWLPHFKTSATFTEQQGSCVPVKKRMRNRVVLFAHAQVTFHLLQEIPKRSKTTLKLICGSKVLGEDADGSSLGRHSFRSRLRTTL